MNNLIVIKKDRIKMLRSQINNLKIGKGICLIKPAEQIKHWEKEIKKAERAIVKAGGAI